MNPSSIRLPEKLAYGLGAIASTSVNASAGYLLFFYTDVAGIAAATAGTLLLIARVWDALWDLFVGRMIDRTHTRLGQCRPFLLVAAFLFPLTMAWTFSSPGLTGAALVAYAAVSFIALQMVFSLTSIPYQSLPTLISDDPVQRAQLAGMSMVGIFATVLLVNGGTMPLVGLLGGADRKLGFLLTMGGFGVLGGLMLLVTVALTRERIAPRPAQGLNLRRDMADVVRNRSWQAMVIFRTGLAAGIGVQLSTTIYFVNYVLKRPDLIGPLMLLGGVAMLVGVPIGIALVKRYSRKWIASLALALAVVASLVYLLLPEQSVLWMAVLNALGGLGLGISGPSAGAFAPDAADHIELDSGRRLLGVTISTLNFSDKVGSGLAGASAGALLGAVGYVGGAATQSPQAVQGILWLFALGPALCFGLAAAAIAWWLPLDTQTVDNMRKRLQQARSATPVPG